jgi:Flp pilus assembly protein protease CpaA
MLEEALRQVAATGVLGAILVVLGLEYRKQSAALAAVQQARVDDAKRVAETLLALNEKWQTAINELTNAVERLNDRDPARRR